MNVLIADAAEKAPVFLLLKHIFFYPPLKTGHLLLGGGVGGEGGTGCEGGGGSP